MVTGTPPWKSLQLANPTALLFHVAKSDEMPPMPDDMDGELRAFILACFTRDPKARPRAEDLVKHEFLMRAASATIPEDAAAPPEVLNSAIEVGRP